MGSSASKDVKTAATQKTGGSKPASSQGRLVNNGTPTKKKNKNAVPMLSKNYSPPQTCHSRSPTKEVSDLVVSSLANRVYEHVFLITTGQVTDKRLPCACVLVPDIAKKPENQTLSQRNVDEAVFERLLMRQSSLKLVHNKHAPTVASGTTQAVEPCAFKYLFDCYVRWTSVKDDKEYADAKPDVDKCKSVILQNSRTSLEQPEMFQTQTIPEQFIDLCVESRERLLDKSSTIYEFIMTLVEYIEKDESCLSECMFRILLEIRNRFLRKFKLMHAAEVSLHTNIIVLFTHRESLAEILWKFNEPCDDNLAFSYEQTLLGSLLAMSPCPRDGEGPYEFFFDVLDTKSTSIHATNVFIWQRLNDICGDVYKIIMSSIKLSTALRHTVLKWLGGCIGANRGKPDLWSAHEIEVFQTDYCSDGFFLNLCHVILRMCQPFSAPNSEKLLKIKPSYCRAVVRSDKDRISKCVHARNLSEEKTFVPYTEEMELPEESSYHFITECFFLAHQAIRIGYSIVHKILKLHTSISRLKKISESAKEDKNYRIVALIQLQLGKEICWYLNIKAAMTEYHLSNMCLKFLIATSSWLVQAATCDDVTEFKDPALPLPPSVPKALGHLPEAIMSNLTIFISSLEIFRGIELLKDDAVALHHFMNVILTYMGSPERLVNSNIRASLAEALEAIVPNANEDGTFDVSPSGNEVTLLKEHPLISHLAEKVLDVFVSIEVTGQSVGDEIKYNYRKSMHLVLQYIWTIPVHKKALKTASENALEDINNTQPPLFLRFLNLIINDAIFLLDEALEHMKQIKDLELERDTGKWNSLSEEKIREKQGMLQNVGMLGRYRNMMANHTIYTLELIAREIRDIFCHDVMVDRIAGMLNYFLEHLVGPKQGEYKVKNMREHEFKPVQLVSDICHIYVYLGENNHFCKAVLGEQRSFSDDLFTQAIHVLQKIGVSKEFLQKFNDLQEKFKSLGAEQKMEEDLVNDAPEEFVDPIMGTLMVDPVILPSSKKSIDRAVIARHLLSDQRDPYTKMALSMDMVTPNTELRDRIQLWKKEKMGEKT